MNSIRVLDLPVSEETSFFQQVLNSEMNKVIGGSCYKYYDCCDDYYYDCKKVYKPKKDEPKKYEPKKHEPKKKYYHC
jgi:hypothetical protein